MIKTNCTSIGIIAGNMLDKFLYDNRRKITAAKFAKDFGVDPKTIYRWRYEGVRNSDDATKVLHAIGASIRVVFDNEDDSVYFCRAFLPECFQIP